MVDKKAIILQKLNMDVNFNSEMFQYIEYCDIEDENKDIPLINAYYEIVDNNGNQYSVRVAEDLAIADGQVIRDASGFVRVQGVKFPCLVAIRKYPIVTNNTEGAIFLEVESDFENRGSSTAIKNLKQI